MLYRTSRKKPLFLVLLIVFSIQSSGIVFAGDGDEGGSSSTSGSLEAIAISATFDTNTEYTTLTWSNLATANLSYQHVLSLLENLQFSTYNIYRHNSVMNESIIANLTPVASVPACLASAFLQCSSESHGGHSLDIPIPPDVNEQLYYAIVTQCPVITPGAALDEDCPAGTNITTLNMNSSHLYLPIQETTEPIKSPYLLQANFNSQTSQTELSWINYNDLSTFEPLSEVGSDAFVIHIWRHSSQVSRATGLDLLNNHEPIANLSPNTNTYAVDVEHNTQFNRYYSVTYEIPNYFGQGQSYEDIRFHSYNTLQNAVSEDTSAPSSISNIIVSCDCAGMDWSTMDGLGNTSIQWTPLSTEADETYEIWRSRTEFSSITEPGVELVGSYFSGDEGGTLEYNYMVPRGTLGYATYCITVTDSRGIRNPSIYPTNCATVFEDMFSPWIAEPTNVDAEYIGNSTTRVSWADQIGVEGEMYHVWRSHQPISSTFWNDGVLETSIVSLVATISDGIGFADISLDFGDGMASYYCVTTQARYNTIYGQYQNLPSSYNSSAGTYEDFRLNQNCVVDDEGYAKPITEDTDLPAKPQVASPTMLGTFGVVEVDWDALTTESNENYFIYRNYVDPFISGNSRSNVTDAGWQLVAGPITGLVTQTSFTALITLPDNHTMDAWYAVVASDEYQNFNAEVTEGFNCYQVREDTAAPLINITFQGTTPDAFSVGNYRILLQVNEILGAATPTINISSSSGESFSEFSSVQTTLLDSVDRIYYFDMDIPVNTLPGDLIIEVSATDPYSNSGTYTLSEWLIDAQDPEIFIYSPSPQAIYRYGDNIEIRGGATDDVGITQVQIRFVRNLDANRVEEPWQNVIDVTVSDIVDNGITFQLDKSSTNFEIGRHKLEILVIDNAGNEVPYSVTFTVDNCQQTADATTECEYARSLTPVQGAPAAEVGITDPPYIIVFALAGFNLLVFILMIGVLSVSSSAPKRGGDDDEDDDWMMEFIGTSAEPDMADITGGSLDSSPERDLSESKALDDDEEDDLFGTIKSEATSKKRNKSKKKTQKDDDDDDFAEESKSKKRRAVKRKK